MWPWSNQWGRALLGKSFQQSSFSVLLCAVDICRERSLKSQHRLANWEFVHLSVRIYRCIAPRTMVFQYASSWCYWISSLLVRTRQLSFVWIVQSLRPHYCYSVLCSACFLFLYLLRVGIIRISLYRPRLVSSIRSTWNRLIVFRNTFFLCFSINANEREQWSDRWGCKSLTTK